MTARPLLGTFALIAFCLRAQEANQGVLTGFVYDQSRAVVANAEITTKNRATGQARTAKTSPEGVYTVVALEPGVYHVRTVALVFKSAEAHDIELTVGISIRVNFELEVGSATETITVEGTSVILKTETGEVSNLVTGTQVTDIPVNGRNFTQFLSLGTGVVSQQTGRQMGLGQEGNPLMAVHGGRSTRTSTPTTVRWQWTPVETVASTCSLRWKPLARLRCRSRTTVLTLADSVTGL